MEWLTDPHAWMALATLTALEIVLGVDNIIFISILCGRLPRSQQAKARTLGLAIAMLTRLGLLFSLTWLMTLTAPLFTLAGKEVSGRDLILIAGGFFLLWKAVHEIHGALEGDEDDPSVARAAILGTVIVQIAIIDVVFSLDSVITAVGLVDELAIMAIAIILAVGVMMFAAGPISRFVDDHPTIKMLALSFLTLIGIALIGEGWDLHIPKAYIYFAMAFSIAVEMLNLRIRSHMKGVRLRKRGPR